MSLLSSGIAPIGATAAPAAIGSPAPAVAPTPFRPSGFVTPASYGTPRPATTTAPASAVPSPAGSPSPSATPSHKPVLPLPAGAVPDVETLRAAIEQGGGVDLKRETLVTSYTEGGAPGTTTSYSDGDDDRTIESYGPTKSEYGTAGGKHWHENANGEVVLDAEAAGKASKETATYRVERAPAGQDAFVLVRTNQRGHVRRSTVDRVTGHVLRVEDISPATTAVYAYDTFRTTGTETRAWHWTYRDGHHENDGDYAIAKLDAGPIDPKELAIPNGRTFVEFPSGVKSVLLPATNHGGHFLVRVTINGRGLDFVLDTGAGNIVIDEGVAKQLGLPILAKSSNPANAGRYISESTVVPEMSVGALKMHDVQIETIPDLDEEDPGVFKAVGLLGFDFIADTKLALDYEKGTVTAYEPSADFTEPTGTKGFIVPIRLGSQTPEADVTINGALAEHFMIDTGAEGAVLVFDYFAKRHPEALTNDGGGDYKTRTFMGVGGEFEAKPYKIKSVLLGKANFSDFPVYNVMTRGAYSFGADGVIGTSFLELFTVYVDYPEGVMGFYLNKTGQDGLAK